VTAVDPGERDKPSEPGQALAWRHTMKKLSMQMLGSLLVLSLTACGGM
jgi:hypothetical protein